MELQKINFLKNVTSFTDALGGYSGAIKKYFKKDGKTYFLKIGKFHVKENLEDLLNSASIPHPPIIESGIFDKDNSYIIEEKIEGTSLKDKLNEYCAKFIYEYGFKIGEKYRNLRKIFPDKCVNVETINDYIKRKDKCLNNLKKHLNNFQQKLSSKQFKFFSFVKSYLTKNYTLIKNSIMVFGHPDMKPSNFFINNNEIFAIDIQNTDYKELSQALQWSYARTDYEDEKNYAFARGYLDGLFNFCIPQGFLKCCNYTYLLNICEKINKYFLDNDLEKINKLIHYIQNNFFKKETICIDKRLNRFNSIKKIPLLKNFEITLNNGSFSPNNLTFKCVKNNKKYFLKIMKNGNSTNLKHCLKCYKVMEKMNVPTSPVRCFGKLDSNKLFYFVFDYIDYAVMKSSVPCSPFSEGEKLGYMVAQELQKLKSYKLKNFEFFTKTDFRERLVNDISIIFKNKEKNHLLIFKKHELLEIIDKLLKNFDDEPISLIHSDVKFGNILYNGAKIVFVDNESLIFSYDIINFYYNIFSKFHSKNLLINQGFIRGYLKYMNNGTIPHRISGQVKLLLLAKLLKDVKEVMNNAHSAEQLPLLNQLCEQYIRNDEEITWLK